MTARNYMKYLHKSQSKYAETNQKIASGNRFTKLSDDVSAGSRVLRLRMDRYKAEKQLENAQEANGKLKVTEDNMMAMNKIMTTVHEYTAQRALNDPSGDSGREIYAAEIRSMMAEFVQYANANYGNMFNYGGTNAYTGPFTISEEGKLLYNSIDVDAIKKDPATGVLMFGGKPVPLDKDIYFDIGLGILVSGPTEDPLVIGEKAFRVSYSGPEMLGFGLDEDGLSNNLYNVMNELQKNLDTFDREEAEKWNMKLRALLDKFRVNLTDIGVKTNFLDASEVRLKNTIDNHTERIQTLMGIDDAEEATDQMMNDYVLKAVLQMGSRVLPLSLMDFVR
ncbi:MAG: hypothetical protein FWF83_01715 [Clostridiales bacterium]|nr:hypothetical protein [Clostridiales bacterium]